MAESFVLRIKRQDGPAERPYWEEFQLAERPNMNVVTALMDIQRHPVNRAGEPVAPVAWNSSCLEEVCGACTMRMNGRVGQSCSTLIQDLDRPITLEPMSKFPVVRDLVVNRQRMFENRKRIMAWIPIDGTHDLGPGPRMAPKLAHEAYLMSRCMSCGCCLDACPNFSFEDLERGIEAASPFMGAEALNQIVLMNLHPTGALHKEERLDAAMGLGGIAGCGNAQNCVEVCPKDIPLTKAIGLLGRDTTKHMFKKWLGLD